MSTLEAQITIAENSSYSTFIRRREVDRNFDEFVIWEPMRWITHFNLDEGFSVTGDYDEKLDDITGEFGIHSADQSEIFIGNFLRKVTEFNCARKKVSSTVFSINDNKMHVTTWYKCGNPKSKTMYLNGERNGLSSEYDIHGKIINLTHHFGNGCKRECLYLENGVEEIRHFRQGNAGDEDCDENGVEVHNTSVVIRGKSGGWASCMKTALGEDSRFGGVVYGINDHSATSHTITVFGSGPNPNPSWIGEFAEFLKQFEGRA